MKKLLVLGLAAAILGCCLTSLAADKTYDIKDIGLSMDIPEDMDVFTRDTKEDAPELEKRGLTKDQIDQIFRSGDIYLNAMGSDGEYEITVMATKAKQGDFADMGTANIKALIKSNTDSGFKNVGYHFIDSDVYEHPQTKFAFIHSSVEEGKMEVYSMQYYTVFDKKNFNISLRSYNSEITPEMEQRLTNIIDSIKLERVGELPAEKSPIAKEVDVSRYIIIIAGVFFATLAVVALIKRLNRQ